MPCSADGDTCPRPAAQVADVEHRANARARDALQSVRSEQHDAVRGWKAELDRRANEVRLAIGRRAI